MYTCLCVGGGGGVCAGQLVYGHGKQVYICVYLVSMYTLGDCSHA